MPSATAAKSKRAATKPKRAKVKAKSVGKLTHYYDHLGVGVITLTAPLKIGDMILCRKGEHEFSQTVESMQLDHKSIKAAKKGQSIGLKLMEKMKPIGRVFKS